ncbi:hypothetical protein DPMN_089835 [Dreissena polymorpha]|uniref:Secreted protein n=1 Tax=Dreissena polymorpha TaxID=45954 RepID=A0A9D4KZ13_DREPO|nr:hypothetical protein DPMN_089835 [Dreissena polymorpha]
MWKSTISWFERRLNCLLLFFFGTLKNSFNRLNSCHKAKLTLMGRSFGKNVHHRLPDVWTFIPGFYPARAGKLEGNKRENLAMSLTKKALFVER